MNPPLITLRTVILLWFVTDIEIALIFIISVPKDYFKRLSQADDMNDGATALKYLQSKTPSVPDSQKVESSTGRTCGKAGME